MAYDSDQRVLLTGGTGFIGQAVVPLLLADGVEVLALTTRPKRVTELWGIDAVDILHEAEGSLRERVRDFRPASLLHLAWSGLPDYSADACLANVEGSLRVIRMALAGGVRRFVSAGSCWEYGDLLGRLSEDLPTSPTSIFAQSKSCINELMATAAQGSGAEARWARIFYVYGSGQRETSLIPTTIRGWRDGAAPDLRDTQRAIDMIHLDDVASGMVALTLRSGPSGTFNLGSGSAVRVADVVELVRAQVDGEETTGVPLVRTGDGATWADIGKMQRAFGWEPRVSLPDGIRLMLA